MSIHPLFAGFKGYEPHALGAALGFAIHVDTAPGALPVSLPTEYVHRLGFGGDMSGFQWGGGWEANGTHCMIFAKPLTSMASAWWAAGLSH
jgi:hypothetical protein